MKIEKLNENQIRFTLTGEDLASRRMKISELAYGSDKAKQLFQEMMSQAAQDYGFEVNNAPLMIEAIPVSQDQLILVVTKVDNPDVIDERFARLTGDGSDDDHTYLPETVGADEVLELIKRLSQAAKKAARKISEKTASSAKEHSKKTPSSNPFAARPAVNSTEGEEDSSFHLARFYLFHDLETVIHAAKAINASFTGISSLFRNADDGNYYLILKKGDASAELFNSVCNILSEYAILVDYSAGMEEFFKEHMDVILIADALPALRQL